MSYSVKITDENTRQGDDVAFDCPHCAVEQLVVMRCRASTWVCRHCAVEVFVEEKRF